MLRHITSFIKDCWFGERDGFTNGYRWARHEVEYLCRNGLTPMDAVESVEARYPQVTTSLDPFDRGALAYLMEIEEASHGESSA